MQSDTKIRVGIVRGMAGEYYESSLQKGGEVITHIFENLPDKYQPIDILIDKDYIWHFNGLPISPSDLAHRVDVVWNTTHPGLSNILESLSIPNVRASSFLSSLSNSKEMLKEHMKKIGVEMPRHVILPVYQKDFDSPRERYAIKKAKEVFEKFGSPWIVRSFVPHSDMGVHLAKTFGELVNSIEDGVKHATSILVEELISGKVASVHSVAGFRGEDIYTFPLVNVFGEFSLGEKEKLIGLAKSLHNHIGAKHYLKSIFVLNKRGKVYLLDIGSMPNFKIDSSFSEACESVGAKMYHVVEHILNRTLG